MCSQTSSGGSGSNMGHSAGWPAYASDRPKSANFSGGNGSSGGAGSAGLMASLTGAGRPSSSQQAVGGGTNWAAQQQQQQMMQQHAMSGGGAGAGNANTLSYGSLKNRFLSGASKNNNGAGTATSSGTNPSNGAKPAASKLFSLAR